MNKVKKIIKRYLLNGEESISVNMRQVEDYIYGFTKEYPIAFSKLTVEAIGNGELILTIEGFKNDR